MTTVNESYVIYSANESGLSGDGAGFWGAEAGWTIIEEATLFSALETKELNLPMSTGNDAQWVKYTEAAKHYQTDISKSSERSVEEKLGNALNSMMQDDARGQVFVFRRENGALIPQEVSPDSVNLENLSEYELIVVDGGNSAGDFWKHVFFLSSKEPKSFFLSEN